jgi:hypothetical protein
MNTARIVVLVVVLVLFVLPLLRLGWRGWRLLRGKDEFVAGGSMGHQMTDKSNTDDSVT